MGKAQAAATQQTQEPEESEDSAEHCDSSISAINFAPKLMSEKPQSDEFEDDEPTDVLGTEDIDVDKVLRDLDSSKRRGQKLGDPVWRRLERIREDKLTAELTSDFEDYDIGLDDDAELDKSGGGSRSKKKRTR